MMMILLLPIRYSKLSEYKDKNIATQFGKQVKGYGKRLTDHD